MYGGSLKLSEVELVQRNTHVLHFALAGLEENTKWLLCRFAIIAESADHDTLLVLFPFLTPRPTDPAALPAYEAGVELPTRSARRVCFSLTDTLTRTSPVPKMASCSCASCGCCSNPTVDGAV